MRRAFEPEEAKLTTMKLLHLFELSFSASDLRALTKQQIACISTLAFAYDEVNVLQNLLAQCSAGYPEDPVACSAYEIQFFTLFRTLSSKQVETRKLFKDCIKLLERNADESSEVLKAHEQQIEKLCEAPSFKLASKVRNDASNHYLVSKVCGQIGDMETIVPFRAYLEKGNGNTFYPFSDVVVFHGAVANHFQENHGRLQTAQDLTDWLDWSMDFRNALVKILEDYMKWILENRLPEIKARPKKPWVDEEFFFKLTESKLPIFYTE